MGHTCSHLERRGRRNIRRERGRWSSRAASGICFRPQLPPPPPHAAAARPPSACLEEDAAAQQSIRHRSVVPRIRRVVEIVSLHTRGHRRTGIARRTAIPRVHGCPPAPPAGPSAARQTHLQPDVPSRHRNRAPQPQLGAAGHVDCRRQWWGEGWSPGWQQRRPASMLTLSRQSCSLPTTRDRPQHANDLHLQSSPSCLLLTAVALQAQHPLAHHVPRVLRAASQHHVPHLHAPAPNGDVLQQGDVAAGVEGRHH